MTRLPAKPDPVRGDPRAESLHTSPSAVRGGFTLIELIVAIVLLAVVASVVLTRWEPNLISQLEAGGAAVAGDLAYVRGLAVAHGVDYEIEWRPESDSYAVMRISSGGVRVPAPAPKFVTGAGTRTDFVEQLARLPSGACELIGVETTTSPRQTLNSIRFNAAGILDPPQEVRIWLAIGQGSKRYFLPVVVAYPTGTPTVGNIQRDKPQLNGSGIQSVTVF